MPKVRVIALTLLVLSPTLGARADDAPPPPPPMGVWIGKGQFGFLSSHGNSEAESVNGNLDMIRYDGNWENDVYLTGLYGKNGGIASAQRWEARLQTNYTISGDLFAFGGLRYERDLYDGFQYQASATGGLGYKFIDSDATKLTGQVGAGYRRLRPEDIYRDADGIVTSRVLHDSTAEAIGTAGVDFLHNFTKTTAVTNKFLMEYGSANTLLHDDIALVVKMSDKLALSVGYGITNNSNPPATIKKLDTVATVNLVFAF
jgi:putative salt-induced outer membrane protein